MNSQGRGPRPDADRAALQLSVIGRVQGVGFRPFVARTAGSCGLSGWVVNTDEGIAIEADGTPEALAEFVHRLTRESPPHSEIVRIESRPIPPSLDRRPSFQILASEHHHPKSTTATFAEIAPDLATCADCLAEFLDPNDRRFGYALSCCTACGPRFTAQRSVPFDRERTSMAAFRMCSSCRDEYDNPADRRFHAQNVACPACGPRLHISLDEELGPRLGLQPDDRASALDQAGRWLKAGAILAVKGIGGFHLICDATCERTVAILRARKRRQRKPLAVIFADLEQLDRHALLDDASRALLSSRSAPIVLVTRRPESTLAEGVAPGLATLGAMLGYSLIHQGLLRAAGRPLVATSANTSGEPMPIEDDAARRELRGVVDAWLLHDRPIVRHADDSVARVIGGKPVWMRLGRGSAPQRLPVPRDLRPVLAVGGHLKSAVALGLRREIILGPHIGDLDTANARRRYREVVDDLSRLHGIKPESVVCDLHPDYFTTRFADELGLPVVAVQHHHAHIAACLAEHGESGPVLGIAWDGTGFGDDGTIWGGEFLRVDAHRAERVGSLVPFPMVGGDRAAREPRRVAASVCFAAGLWPPHPDAFTETELRLLGAALRSSRFAATCTSAGRLFDAWGALLGLCARSAYEAEAAIQLEECADTRDRSEFPVAPVEMPGAGRFPRIDWRPWVAETVLELGRGVAPAILSARFHNSMARGCLEMARIIGLETVVLGGGCFQNRLLTERVSTLLFSDGFRVLRSHRVPPGDGGLAVGQIWATATRD